MATSVASIAYTLALTGQLEQAEDGHREALTVFRKLGSRDREANVLNNIAWILWFRGDLPAAQRTAEEAVAISKQVG